MGRPRRRRLLQRNLVRGLRNQLYQGRLQPPAATQPLSGYGSGPTLAATQIIEASSQHHDGGGPAVLHRSSDDARCCFIAAPPRRRRPSDDPLQLRRPPATFHYSSTSAGVWQWANACYKTTSSPALQNLHCSTTTSAVRRCSAVAVTPLGDFHCSSTMAPSAMRCSITAVATSDDVPL